LNLSKETNTLGNPFTSLVAEKLHHDITAFRKDKVPANTVLKLQYIQMMPRNYSWHII
jgi:hypothetical protein